MDDLLPGITPAAPETIGPFAIASLLAPISEQNPTGIDLRDAGSSSYLRLRECRANARNNERAAMAEGEVLFIDPRDWSEIIDGVPLLLQAESKDLEVTAWLIEALARRDGFAGVAAGFSLARRLLEQYGNTLFPLPDDEGAATQFAALTGLNGFGSEGTLIAPLKSIPLTEGSPPAPFCGWQCEQAFDLQRIGDEERRNARGKRGFVLPEQVEQAVAETSPGFFRQLYQEIQTAIAEFAAYVAVLDRNAGEAPQPTTRISETLDSIRQLVRHLAGDRLGSAEPAMETPPPPEVALPAAAAATAASHAVNERDAALRQLREVAAFFRRTEPHSPISYAIEQAVRWSGLSLPELLGELIPEEAARDKYKLLAGIRADK